MFVQAALVEADEEVVQLTNCPYDSTPIEAETCSGGSLLLSCPCCDAAWEWHGAWLRRLREPDRDAVRAARGEVRSTEPTI